MLNNSAVDEVVKGKFRQGFTSLVINLSNFVSQYHFIEYPSQLCPQPSIQKNSYIFIERLFGEKSQFANCGKQMQIYLAKLDITEIECGSVDLSHPSLNDKAHTDDAAHTIIKQNDFALTYLKTPFSADFFLPEFSEKIIELNNEINSSHDDFHHQIITDFLTSQNKALSQVVLFCEVLNLICMSQSLYAFSYQIKANPNFAGIIELVLKLKSQEISGVDHVEKLAERFFQIFIGNLAARVYSHQTLEIVEKALSAGTSK